MISAVLDTNVILQSLIGSPSSASSRTVQSLFAGNFAMIASQSTLGELTAVLNQDRVQQRHNLNEVAMATFFAALLTRSRICDDAPERMPSLVRDITDRKFLSLAEAHQADFLVTNDRRHLIPLKQVGNTRIVTPAAFLKALGR